MNKVIQSMVYVSMVLLSYVYLVIRGFTPAVIFLILFKVIGISNPLLTIFLSIIGLGGVIHEMKMFEVFQIFK